MLLKKGKRDAAKSVKDLMTNSISDLRKITVGIFILKTLYLGERNFKQKDINISTKCTDIS